MPAQSFPAEFAKTVPSLFRHMYSKVQFFSFYIDIKVRIPGFLVRSLFLSLIMNVRCILFSELKRQEMCKNTVLMQSEDLDQTNK